jgi:hypothetical protein
MSNPRPSVGRGRARGRLRQDGSPGISPVGLRNTDVTRSDVPRVVAVSHGVICTVVAAILVSGMNNLKYFSHIKL